MSKYHKIQYLKRAITAHQIDNPYFKDNKKFLSESWHSIYVNAIDEIDRSTDLNWIDIHKFIARYAIRQMQLLGQDEHRKVVEYHYLHCKIENATLKIVKNPEIIQKALRFKLDNPYNYRKQLSGYENIIGEELQKLGFDTNDPQVILWGLTSGIGKWKLSTLVDQEYNRLSIWESRPASDAVEVTLNLADCYFEYWYDVNKKTGKKAKKPTIKFAMQIPS